MKIAIRQSQKINSRIHNSRIAIRQRIAQLGSPRIGGSAERGSAEMSGFLESAQSQPSPNFMA